MPSSQTLRKSVLLVLIWVVLFPRQETWLEAWGRDTALGGMANANEQVVVGHLEVSGPVLWRERELQGHGLRAVT